MSLILRTPWTSQPQVAVGVDRSNPITQGLAGLWLPGGNGLVDVAGRMGNMAATGASIYPTNNGVAHDLNGSSNYLTNAAQTGITNVPLTMSVWIFPDAIATGRRIFDISTGVTSNDVIGIQLASATLNAQHFDGSTNALASVSNSGMVGKWTHVCAVFESLSSRKLFVNGVQVAISTTTAAAPSGIDRVTCGYAPWAGEFFDGRILAPRIWSRSLSAAEVAADYRNPWQLFAPLARRIWAPGAAAATAPTLSAATYASLTSTTVRPRVTVTF